MGAGEVSLLFIGKRKEKNEAGPGPCVVGVVGVVALSDVVVVWLFGVRGDGFCEGRNAFSDVEFGVRGLGFGFGLIGGTGGWFDCPMDGVSFVRSLRLLGLFR